MQTQNKRVISLIPSATEIVCALGLESWLVGISHECDFPRRIKQLPVCSEAKFDTHRSSLEIDQSVIGLVKNGLSVYNVFADILNELKPDIIITQAQCEVCAVSLKDVQQAVCHIVESRPGIISLEPMNLADIFKDIQKVAYALHIPTQGKELIASLQNRIHSVRKLTELIPDKPTVACIEWLEPLMNAGNWMPEIIELAGGINAFGTAGEHSHYITWNDILQNNPDVLLIMPCGFDIPRILHEINLLTSKPGWENLKAVQHKQVYITDGNQYFNRPGPRIVDSLEIIAEILYPPLFAPTYHQQGWINYEEITIDI